MSDRGFLAELLMAECDDRAIIHTLATCDWVRKGLPLSLIGDSGTGKSRLPIALGTEAADDKRRC